MVSLEVCCIVGTAAAWVSLVPVALIATDIAKSVVGVSTLWLHWLWSETTTAGTALGSSSEKLVVVGSAGVWVSDVPGTSVAEAVDSFTINAASLSKVKDFPLVSLFEVSENLLLPLGHDVSQLVALGAFLLGGHLSAHVHVAAWVGSELVQRIDELLDSIPSSL